MTVRTTKIAADRKSAAGASVVGRLRIRVGASGRPHAVLASAPAGLTVDEVMARTYIWHVWPGRNWPLTAAEEAAFVSELARAAAVDGVDDIDTIVGIGEGDGMVERGVVTALMNALRCGLSAAELLDRAPGLDPAHLLYAYRRLDEGRCESLAAFDEIVADPTLESLVLHTPAAQTLMSVPVRQMTPAGGSIDDGAVAAAVTRVLRLVDSVTSQAAELELGLSRCRAGEAAGVEIGRMLYDPYSPTLWSNPYYRPARVGDLVPLRVADLLGERRP